MILITYRLRTIERTPEHIGGSLICREHRLYRVLSRSMRPRLNPGFMRDVRRLFPRMVAIVGLTVISEEQTV